MTQRGQSAIEFAVLIVVAALVFTAFFAFARNAVSYRYKSGADGIGHGLRY